MPMNSTGALSACSSAPGLLQVGGLGDARRAPRAPHVEHEHLAPGARRRPRRVPSSGVPVELDRRRRACPRGSSRRRRRRRRSPSGRRPWPGPRPSWGPGCSRRRRGAAQRPRPPTAHRAVGRTVMRPPRAGPGRAATRPARCSSSESSSSSRKVSEVSDASEHSRLRGVVPQRPALGGQPDHPDRGLVADDDGLVAAGGGAGVDDRPAHPLDELDVGLAPRRPERVEHLRVEPRVLEDAGAPGDRQALEVVLGLDDPVVEGDLEAVGVGDRRGGLLGALERAGDEVGDVVVAEVLGGEVGHLAAELGQVVARHPAVEQAVRVVHLTVAQQVHDGALRVDRGQRHRPRGTTSCADCRKPGWVLRHASRHRPRQRPGRPPGRAATTRSTAASSCAPETNHDSNALGGR